MVGLSHCTQAPSGQVKTFSELLGRCDHADGRAQFRTEFDRIEQLKANPKQKQKLREKLRKAEAEYADMLDALNGQLFTARERVAALEAELAASADGHAQAEREARLEAALEAAEAARAEAEEASAKLAAAEVSIVD